MMKTWVACEWEPVNLCMQAWVRELLSSAHHLAAPGSAHRSNKMCLTSFQLGESHLCSANLPGGQKISDTQR